MARRLLLIAIMRKLWYHSQSWQSVTDHGRVISETCFIALSRAPPARFTLEGHAQTRISPAARVDSCDQSRYTSLASHLWKFETIEFAIGR